MNDGDRLLARHSFLQVDPHHGFVECLSSAEHRNVNTS